MPAWLMPAFKAILPHIGTIISAAAPVFTKRGADAAAEQSALLQQQITELQTAASNNAEHIRELAEQMQKTVAVLEESAAVLNARLNRCFWLGVAAMGLAAVALGVAILKG